MAPLLLRIHGITIYGFRGYLALPDMIEVWPLPDPDELIEIG